MKKLIGAILIALLILSGCSTAAKVDLNTGETVEKFEAKESFVLFITSSTCPACQIYDETYDEVSKNYKDTLYKIDYQSESRNNPEDFKALLEDHLGFIEATPTTLFIVDGEVMDKVIGIMLNSDLESTMKYLNIVK